MHEKEEDGNKPRNGEEREKEERKEGRRFIPFYGLVISQEVRLLASVVAAAGAAAAATVAAVAISTRSVVGVRILRLILRTAAAVSGTEPWNAAAAAAEEEEEEERRRRIEFAERKCARARRRAGSFAVVL